jgi:hypothetical protein
VRFAVCKSVQGAITVVSFSLTVLVALLIATRRCTACRTVFEQFEMRIWTINTGSTISSSAQSANAFSARAASEATETKSPI